MGGFGARAAWRIRKMSARVARLIRGLPREIQRKLPDCVQKMQETPKGDPRYPRLIDHLAGKHECWYECRCLPHNRRVYYVVHEQTRELEIKDIGHV